MSWQRQALRVVLLLGGLTQQLGTVAVAQGLPTWLEPPFSTRAEETARSESRVPRGSGVDRSWLFVSHPSGDSKLLRVDELDGDTSLIGEIGRNGVSDIAFLPDGRLFGIRILGNVARQSDLMRINPRTGVGEIISNMGFGGVNALEASDGGTLYAANLNGEFLEVDVATGEARLVGPLGSNLASVGDLAFDSEATLFATVAVNPDFNRPIPTSLATIDPRTGAATVVGPIGFDDVFGLTFHPGTVLDVGGAELRGPALLGLTGGIWPGTTPELIVIDPTTGAGQLVTELATADSMSGMARHLRPAPFRGDLETISFAAANAGNTCSQNPDTWTVCQDQAPPEHAAGIDADDTYAWAANLAGNQDAGQPVYPVAPGRAVSLYGQVDPGGDGKNTVLIEHCTTEGPCDCQASPTDCWWTRYSHMTSVAVAAGQEVTPCTFLGFISDVGATGSEQLDFALYEGENRREQGQGLLKSVDAVWVSIPPIFRDGFGYGDTACWSATSPPP